MPVNGTVIAGAAQPVHQRLQDVGRHALDIAVPLPVGHQKRVLVLFHQVGLLRFEERVQPRPLQPAADNQFATRLRVGHFGVFFDVPRHEIIDAVIVAGAAVGLECRGEMRHVVGNHGHLDVAHHHAIGQDGGSAQQLFAAGAGVQLRQRGIVPRGVVSVTFEDLAFVIQRLSGKGLLDHLLGFMRRTHAFAIAHTHHAVPFTTGADHDARAAPGVFVQREDRIRNFQRVHFVGADHHHAQADFLAGERQRHQAQECISGPGIVLRPDGAKAIAFGEQAQLGDFIRGEIGFEYQVKFHGAAPVSHRWLTRLSKNCSPRPGCAISGILLMRVN